MGLKPETIKNNAIRGSARGENCALRIIPGCNPDTVVAAHLNSNYKGMGNKSPDIFVVYACMRCHALLDAGKVHPKIQLRALQETQYKLMQKGLITPGGS